VFQARSNCEASRWIACSSDRDCAAAGVPAANSMQAMAIKALSNTMNRLSFATG
jgi:hypothetical protein